MPKRHREPTDEEVLNLLSNKRPARVEGGYSVFTEVCKLASPLIAATQKAFEGTKMEHKAGIVSLSLPGIFSVFPVEEVRAQLALTKGEGRY